ncbi:hypothetical protein GH733_014015 [Mirounga leonina]|nr:hypothetical protein GH733_014015 [Mirounga leonina]
MKEGWKFGKCPEMGSRLQTRCLWKAPGHSDHGSPVHTKLQNKEHMIGALHRAKFKFPGGHVTHISKKWGFTKFNTDEFEDRAAEKQFILDGCRVKYIPNCDPLGQMPESPGCGGKGEGSCPIALGHLSQQNSSLEPNQPTCSFIKEEGHLPCGEEA